MSNLSFVPASPGKSSTQCRYFASNGFCYYGDQCNFSHSPGASPASSPVGKPVPAIARSRRPCRNIAIHGFCKFKDKGCDYNHDAQPAGAVPFSPPRTIPQLSNPRSETSLSSSPGSTWLSSLAAVSPPGRTYGYDGTVFFAPPQTPQADPVRASPMKTPSMAHMTHAHLASSPTHQVESIGGTTYFYQPNSLPSPRPSPKKNLFQGPPFHSASAPTPSQSMFMSEPLRLELLHRNACLVASLDPEARFGHPQSLENYHNLYPLEGSPANPLEAQPIFGVPSVCYRATRQHDNMPCCLRLLKGGRLPHDKALTIAEQWRRVQHANVACLLDAFTTNALGEQALVFVSTYHAGAETLAARYFTSPSAPLTEDLLWAFVVQISSAIRCIHSLGLACRTLDPTKIIIQGKNRLRLSAVGVVDTLTFASNRQQPIHYHQVEDLQLFGKLVLGLACMDWQAAQRENWNRSMELVGTRYSAEFKNLLGYLLSPPQGQVRGKSINDVMPLIGPRFYTELESAYLNMDRLEGDLSREVTNGRLFRLLCKLGWIVDRPELDMDPSWAETGDRYLLKLFRDYVFHQVTAQGEPVASLSFTTQCLNKLDVGTAEKLCLMSRDEQSVLVVSYADLKKCINGAFNELAAAASTP
eukprot:comp22277_c2_seq1/m.32970 comp22277_c2_seq1/g.32970  ORF comp22277_c2_seq1/g.32970 comp22277_c2_seq1/m.32970 type:complete len:641 (-) comp22277_c2_seq1:587-2509(-)